MSYIEFLPRHDIRAVELAHCVLIAIPEHVARLIGHTMGTPSVHSDRFAAWYGDFNLYESADETTGLMWSQPFAMRIENGNASLQVPFSWALEFSSAIQGMVPELVADVHRMEDYRDRLRPAA